MRFFFDCKNDSFATHDEIGTVLKDLDQVRKKMARVMGETVRETVANEACGTVLVNVRMDGDDVPIMRASLSFDVSVPDRPATAKPLIY